MTLKSTGILIIDDDEAIRDALAIVLENEGFEVQQCSNGSHGLNHLRTTEQLPQLIFLDWMMPFMSGAQFLKAWESDSSYRLIPIYVLSAITNLEITGKISGYIQKPVDLEKILEIGSRHCSQAS